MDGAAYYPLLESRLVMVWLNGWVKELILIILLASFTDLLLPSHALQRYVRTVIGLFLLLVLLSPLYELFHHRWTPNQWMQAALGETSAKGDQMQSLSEIVTQSNELKTANQKQAKQLLESQLAVSMKESIESQNQVIVKTLQVTTQLDDNGKPTIDQVKVVLGESGQEDKKGDSPQSSQKPFIAAMKPVEPVVIDLKTTDNGDNQTKPASSIKDEPLTAIQDEVKQFIAKEWQLKPSQVRISS
ncbi:stage III sporulation protein AF [Paenibacillus psychroresistens]|uniref:Stage III sporulation protein AF n=1 Tax=Paenibacillus psychroresistens TaxID=1778678 RepID=A0A6B8RLB9_9BACL|nr:stage III sporulation protein AF [Paenibacillus psychroresistens]QGQ97110.1 stage III sporulation protein AF [Paenibacillus psychroresistens]